MSWQDWQNPNTKLLWDSILDRLESIAVTFAETHPEWECAVTRTHWDAPNLEVRWRSNGLERNVNQLIRGTEWPVAIEFSGAAWADENAERVFLRELHLSQPDRTIHAVSLNELNAAAAALAHAAEQVNSITRFLAARASGD
jgi:hypothetical protein